MFLRHSIVTSQWKSTFLQIKRHSIMTSQWKADFQKIYIKPFSMRLFSKPLNRTLLTFSFFQLSDLDSNAFAEDDFFLFRVLLFLVSMTAIPVLLLVFL
jgi:hypothetical protein